MRGYRLGVVWVLAGLYGMVAFVSLLNLILMRRLRAGGAPTQELAVLIPARNEEANLGELVPALVAQGLRVYVYDDASEDGTARAAAEAGAIVLRGQGPPPGWLGKNHGCHRLAQAMMEDHPGEWFVFLDADTRVGPGFRSAIEGWIDGPGRRLPVMTGFPKVVPGQGIEPLFLAWVGWVLLASNPFGLVSRSGMAHNRFLNGQFQVWRKDVYGRLWPHEALKGAVLEDVRIGRLLARERVPVDVVEAAGVLEVRMYQHWRETLDGMSKNTYEVTGSGWGTLAVALAFVLAGLGWLAMGAWWWLGLSLLTLSGVFVVTLARTAFWPALLMPVVCLIGAFTALRSWRWHATGRVVWKGRRV